MTALVRYTLADFARSQRYLAPLVAFVAGLAVLYSLRPNPVLSSYAGTAMLLYPLAAWWALALLGAEDETQREITATAGGGLTRLHLAKLASVVLLVVGLALAAVLVPLLLGAFGRTPSPADLLTGLLAQLSCALPGAALGALLSGPVVRRQGYALVLLLLGLLLTVPLDRLRTSSASAARLLGHAVPPAVAVARALADTLTPQQAAARLLPDALGALAFTAVALAAYLHLARIRA